MNISVSAAAQLNSFHDALTQIQYLLSVDFVQTSLLAALVLGILSGVMAPLVVMREMSFSVHGTSELALMGASAALLAGLNVGTGAIVGSVIAAIVLALLGMRRQDSAVGVVMSFGMGLSVLFISLYPGKSSTAFALLTGQIVGLSSAHLYTLIGVAVLVVATIFVLWRPLLFASADPDQAAAASINVRLIAIAFAVLVGLTTAQSVQIVGALLVMALLITPGAAAVAVTNNPVMAVALSTVFALTASVGGFILSLAPGLPVSVFVTSISFAIYVCCRFIGWYRSRCIRTNHRADSSPDHCHDHHR